MSKSLSAALSKMSAFTTPPADVVAEALEAYEAKVEELEAQVANLKERVGAEVSFQSFIRKSEQEARTALAETFKAEKRALIAEIGFAATIRDRVLNAQWHGRKTVKIDALLEGRPADQDVAA